MPVEPEKSTNLIPVDELLEIVTEAGLVHQRDYYETSLSNLIVKGGDPLADLSTAYDLAAALGIPESRLDAVIQTRYPSADDQLAALETQGATATTGAVARTQGMNSVTGPSSWSIILGLGTTHLLTGVGRLIHGRSRIRWYGPTLGWVGLLLVIHFQTWCADCPMSGTCFSLQSE